MKLPAEPPEFNAIYNKLSGDQEALVRIWKCKVKPAPDGHYRHWDELRFRTPPEGLTLEEWWFAIK